MAKCLKTKIKHVACNCGRRCYLSLAFILIVIVAISTYNKPVGLLGLTASINSVFEIVEVHQAAPDNMRTMLCAQQKLKVLEVEEYKNIKDHDSYFRLNDPNCPRKELGFYFLYPESFPNDIDVGKRVVNKMGKGVVTQKNANNLSFCIQTLK